MVHGRMFRVSAMLATILSVGIAQGSGMTEAVPGEFLVKVKKTSELNTKKTMSLFGATEVRLVSQPQNIYLIKKNILERPEFAMRSLQADSNFEIVEPNYIYRANLMPNDPKLTDLWGLSNFAQKGGKAGVDVGAEKAWDIQTGSRDVVVAVIDTGMDYTHPDLAANAWVNMAELNGVAGVDDDGNGYVDDIHGYDFANNDADPMDDHGHGTHCSGTIGAKGNDGKGIVGVSWDVRIMAIKFLTAEGSGTLENAIKSIDYATAMGAHIQSNSWGGGAFTQLLKEAIERARDKNVLFVAAAGNETNDNDANPSYPASYDLPNIVSVAALDNAGKLAYFSNYGRTSVHVAAPGVDITSSVPKKIKAEGYDTWSGTSMAAPHVSGIAALLKANDSHAGYKEIKSKIIDSARSLGTLRNKVASNGIANAYYALSGEVPPLDMEDPYNWTTTAASAESAHPYKNNAAESFVVTVPGAKQVSIYFERFETERGYDVVEFVDSTGKVVGKWSGNHNGEFAPTVNGDTVTINLKSDGNVNGFGFIVTKAAFK
ncbi:MAG: S8 family serine peptidase [Bdellovibrionales bacterium]|nr:S8 family serine peptidase [Bdellovibrionales bacterium]